MSPEIIVRECALWAEHRDLPWNLRSFLADVSKACAKIADAHTKSAAGHALATGVEVSESIAIAIRDAGDIDRVTRAERQRVARGLDVFVQVYGHTVSEYWKEQFTKAAALLRRLSPVTAGEVDRNRHEEIIRRAAKEFADTAFRGFGLSQSRLDEYAGLFAELIRSVIDELRPPPITAGEWQDISTAPTNDYVLLSKPDYGPLPVVAKQDGFGRWWDAEGNPVFPAPTFWMPLPLPPSPKEAGR